MNTALKTNVYHFPTPDNKITKSRQQIKKDFLLDKLCKAIRLKHYSKATERMYSNYVGDFIDYQLKQPHPEQGAKAIESYLSQMAQKKVSASTQNVAFNALLFFYRRVLNIEPGEINALRAKKPQRVPVVCTRNAWS